MQAGRCCGIREPAVRSRDLHFKPGPSRPCRASRGVPYLSISIRSSDLPEWPSLAATPRPRPSNEQPARCSRKHRRLRRQPHEGSRSWSARLRLHDRFQTWPRALRWQERFSSGERRYPRTPRSASAWTEDGAAHPMRCAGQVVDRRGIATVGYGTVTFQHLPGRHARPNA